MNEALLTRDLGPAVETMIVKDMLRRCWPAFPVAILLGGLVAGLAGAASTAFGLGLAVGNFVLSAAMLAWAARISIGLLLGVTLGGYILRLALITVAVLLVKDMGWVRLVPLCTSLLVAHLGLLAWEARFVSTSLAFPGLKPVATKTPAMKKGA